MPIFILDLIENFFIIWFVTTCCNIDIFKNIIKLILVVFMATIFSILIQSLQIFNTDLDMFTNIVIGVLLYVYLIIIFYFDEVKFVKCFIYTFIYFLIFIFCANIIYNPIFDDNILKSNIYKLCFSIPQRIVEIFINLLINYRKGLFNK